MYIKYDKKVFLKLFVSKIYNIRGSTPIFIQNRYPHTCNGVRIPVYITVIYTGYVQGDDR